MRLLLLLLLRVETVSFWDRIGVWQQHVRREAYRGGFLYASESFIYELGQLTHTREGCKSQARKKVNVLAANVFEYYKDEAYLPPSHSPPLHPVKLALVFDFDFDMEMAAGMSREAGKGKEQRTVCCGCVPSKCRKCYLTSSAISCSRCLSLSSPLPSLSLSLSLLHACF